MSDITQRKSQHLDLVLAGRGQQDRLTTGLEHIAFEHLALPEVSLHEIDTSSTFMGRRLRAPLLVSAMTGGPERAATINANLAEVCEELGIALSVGSQRIALEAAAAGGLDLSLRRRAPTVPILGNIGAAQLGVGTDAVARLAEAIGADLMVVHLNPLQEALQAEGDHDWRGLTARLEALVKTLGLPVGVKEVGCGLSPTLAKRLSDMDIAVLDVAGAGGTSWARIEAERSQNAHLRAVAEPFFHWGIPTAEAIAGVRQACPDAVIIGSGGLRDGLDVAKALRLGANLAGMAAGLLEAAAASAEALDGRLRVVIDQLRLAMFCTGSATLEDLRRAPLRAAG